MSDDPTPILKDSVAQSRKEFNASVAALRPRLHRFCTRMCGSVLDGEDVAQEALADAFYNLGNLRDDARFEPWLFRIAYFKCIDFLRRDVKHSRNAALDDVPDIADEANDDATDTPIDDALVALVSELPPKERASVVLKDVLDYSLTEIATIADTTLGGVKAALHRGRTKLRAMTSPPTIAALDASQRQLFEAYADVFNRRDWDALRSLVRADARLEIVGEKEGIMAGLGATYQGNYTRLPWEWRLTPAFVDGELAIVHERRTGDAFTPHTAIRLWAEDGVVTRIRDYVHVDHLLTGATLSAV